MAGLLRTLVETGEGTRGRVCQAAGISEAQALIEERPCEVALFDMAHDERGDLDSLRCLLQLSPTLPVLALVDHGREQAGHEAVEMGAADYLVKSRLDAGNLFCVLLRHIVERQNLRESLDHMMLIDELTGLCNRRGFLALLQQQLRLSERSKRDLSVMTIALGGLDHIIAEFGAHAGEIALMEGATVLRETFRVSDIIARVAGNEFAVVAIDAHPNSEAAILSRLRDRLLLQNAKATRGYMLEFRTGVARYQPGQRADISDLLASAREAMKATAMIG
jgi:two-component system, cell cycle response regulator